MPYLRVLVIEVSLSGWISEGHIMQNISIAPALAIVVVTKDLQRATENILFQVIFLVLGKYHRILMLSTSLWYIFITSKKIMYNQLSCK